VSDLDILDELTAAESDAIEEAETPPGALKLKTKKFALQSLLDKAASVVPTKDLLPVLKNFLIVAEPGHVRVIATDLELSVIATSEMVTVQEAGTAVFPAKRLLDIVKEAEDGDLEISVEKGEALIEVGKTHWKLKLMDGSDYPELPDASEVEWYEVDRAKLIGAIRSVRYAAATETVRPSLMMIDVEDGNMRASDGVRFQQVPVGDKTPDMQIPINAVDDLLKTLNTTEAQKIAIGEDEDCLIFKIGGDVFIAQKLNAKFPDVNEMLLKPALANDKELNVDRQDLVSAIKRVRITADPETSGIVLELKPDAMIVRSKDKYGSTCEEEITAKWSDGERNIAFNHQHLLDMLTMADVKSCQFFLGQDTKTRPSPLLLKDESSGMVGVLNQVRLDWLG
jgi:DNA polymerase-3 subunit beta